MMRVQKLGSLFLFCLIIMDLMIFTELHLIQNADHSLPAAYKVTVTGNIYHAETDEVITEEPASAADEEKDAPEAKDEQTKLDNVEQNDELSDENASLYKVLKDTEIFDENGEKIGAVKSGELFTGSESAEEGGTILIDYLYSTASLDADKVKKKSKAKILPTSSIGQWGGKIYGISSCGPTAVAILMNCEKGTATKKDSLIKYSKKHNLEDQGAIDETGGGMTAPRLIELIDGYYKGEYTAKNIYGKDPIKKICKQIDKGHRTLVAVRYTTSIVEDYPPAGVHFVVVCGYEDGKNGKIFYYADPYYGDGGRTLLKVSADKLENSMKQVDSEPKTLLIVE